MQKSIAFYIYSVILVRKVFENNKNKKNMFWKKSIFCNGRYQKVTLRGLAI